MVDWMEQRFRERIAPRLFAHADSVTHPVAIALGGQPGAGKTQGMASALALHDQRIIPIVGDDLRQYHPEYEQLKQNDPAMMPHVTAEASGRWVEMALDYAREHRYSVLVEGTFRRPEVTLGTLRAFADSGYDTHVVALAVPQRESYLSTVERYVHDRLESGSGRWTPAAAHTAGYEGTPLTVHAAESSDAVHRLTVMPRSGEVVFDGSGAQKRGAAAMLNEVREQRPGAIEAREWTQRANATISYLNTQMPRTADTSTAAENLQSMVRVLRNQQSYPSALAQMMSGQERQSPSLPKVPRVSRDSGSGRDL